MEKPITMQRKETKEKIYKVMQESQLHLALLKPLVDEVQREIEGQYNALEQREAQQYAEAQKKDQEESQTEKKVTKRDRKEG